MVNQLQERIPKDCLWSKGVHRLGILLCSLHSFRLVRLGPGPSGSCGSKDVEDVGFMMSKQQEAIQKMGSRMFKSNLRRFFCNASRPVRIIHIRSNNI